MPKQMSFGKIRETVSQALYAKFKDVWIRELYDDHVIYENEGKGKYYRIPYAFAEDGTVTLVGEPVEVNLEYIPITAASRIIGAVGKKDTEDYGYLWDVVIIEPGVDKQGIYEYPADVLQSAAPLYDGAKVFAVSEAQHTTHDYGKSVRDIVGWLSEVAYQDGVGLVGKFNILRGSKWLRDMLVESWAKNKKDIVGLSHDIRGKSVPIRGSKTRRLKEVYSVTVDVVYAPIGGGKITRMAAAFRVGQKEEVAMKQLLRLLAALDGAAYDKVKDKEGVTEDAVITLLASAMKGIDESSLDERIAAAVKKTLETQGENGQTQGGELDQQISAAVNKALEGAGLDKAKDDFKIAACRLTLKEELSESSLPELSRSRVKKQFEGKVFATDALRAAIKDEKEYLDKIRSSGRPEGYGDVLQVGVEEPERLQAAMDKLFGVKVKDELNNVPLFKGIRDAYVNLTGDIEVKGSLQASHQRLVAAFTSTTFSYVLGNTLYRRLIQDYREGDDYGANRLISTRRNAKDFRTIESVRIGYFGDLPDVNPESADYADLGTLSDEEVSYALNQKGGLVIISRKMIINDDMSTVQKIVSRLPRAARRTLAKRIWNKFITNATYDGDSLAIFHATHGNLGSVALGYSSVDTADTALFDMTEPDSGEKIGLRGKTLAIPRALLATAIGLNQSKLVPGSANNDANPVFHMFGANNENIQVVPFFTDPNDWYLFADSQEVEIVEVAFLNGQEEPEMFVADNPAEGQMFIADKTRFKIRHEYECEVVDYRGTYKAAVV